MTVRKWRASHRVAVGAADVALAATVHDPSGTLKSEIRRWLPVLQPLYRGLAVAASPATAASVRALLAAYGVRTEMTATDSRGPLYRLALHLALATGASRVHYLDLDRALHWAMRCVRELAAVLRVASEHPVLVVGRTLSAHRTHHRPLYATEETTNRHFVRRLGLPGRVDFLVPSFVLTREAALRLRMRSRARGPAMYGEWAALLAGLAGELAYVECRGLDWETPDRHRRAVRRMGLRAWRSRMESPAEWARRTAMAAEFVRGFDRALERLPLSTPKLLRLPMAWSRR